MQAHAARELKKELRRQRKEKLALNQNPRQDLFVHSEDEEAVETPLRKRHQKQLPPREYAQGLIVETGPGFCDVICGDDRIRCRAQVALAIGDQVEIDRRRRHITHVLPRRTALSRPDPHNPKLERVIAANIDLVVNVVSLRNPPLRPGLIDRYLIAIERSGAEPLVCVNKIDLIENRDELAALDPYLAMGIPVVFCSAANGLGVQELASVLCGKTCVFSGHSGVGKSSLLNAFDPQLHLATGEISEATNAGRHTTTSSSMHRLSNGAIVIDTPGIREFGLWDVRPADVHRYFRDLVQYSQNCAFSDCLHIHEPDCGVQQAVEEQRISAARYAAYRRIMDSLPERRNPIKL
jgi:ribosome biogenesis GTPase